MSLDLLGVVDTTVLNNFAQVGRPYLLGQAFSSLAVPEAVFQELRRGESLGLLPSVDWTWLSHIELTPAEQVRADQLSGKWGLGESACIAVAEARKGFILTDDLGARRLATASGLIVTGTLGTLDRLIQREVLGLEEADELLIEMIARGYRSPVASLQPFKPR